MKTILKFLAFTVFMTLFSFQAEAQRQGSRNMDPEARAEAETQQMVEDLALSEAQAVKVKEVNLKYAQKMGEARADAGADRSGMREVMIAMRTERMEEMKTYLSEEQFGNYEKLLTERRQERGNRQSQKNKKAKKPSDKKSNGVGSSEIEKV